MAGRHGRYLALLFGLLATAVAGIVGLNWWVDPYGLYRSPREGYEPLGFFQTLRTGKARAVERLRPQAVVLGTSRAELGFDPDHPAWPDKPAYNLAVSGGALYESYRLLQHAHHVAPLRRAVIAVELGSFLAVNEFRNGLDESVLAVDVEGRPTAFSWRRTLLPLLSWDALGASLVELRDGGQRFALAAKRGSFLYRANGQRDGRSKAEYFQRTGGHLRAVRRQEDKYLKAAARKTVRLQPQPQAEFERLLDFAAGNGIALTVVLDPMHARGLEIYDLGGRWPLFEAWKRRLTALVAARQGPGTSIELWDFTGYSPVTTEPVPTDPAAAMVGYWELSHYKSAVGDRVLATIFGMERPDPESSFGVRLTPETLEAHLERIRRERRAFRAGNPDLVAELRAKARQYRLPAGSPETGGAPAGPKPSEDQAGDGDEDETENRPSSR